MNLIRKHDYVDIELNSGTIHRSWLTHSIGANDALANSFGVRLFRDGEPINLEGGSVQGYFRNSQGQNILITETAGIAGNIAYVALPQACYNYEGPFTLAIKVISDDNEITGTMRIVDGMVDNTNSSGAVAPVGTVPTYQEVLAVFDQMVAAKAGSVRFDITQDLTSAQQLKARNNIAGASQADMDTVNAKIGNTPLPTTAQTLTGAIAEEVAEREAAVAAEASAREAAVSTEASAREAAVSAEASAREAAVSAEASAREAAVAAEEAAREAAEATIINTLTPTAELISGNNYRIVIKRTS